MKSLNLIKYKPLKSIYGNTFLVFILGCAVVVAMQLFNSAGKNWCREGTLRAWSSILKTGAHLFI